MRQNNYRHLLLAGSLGLSACTTQSYLGPALPDEQTAIVSLPAPVISLLPFFWIPPLHFFTWLSSDWFETVDYDIKVDEITLNRFKSAAVLPGKHFAYAERSVSSTELAGSESCTYSTSKSTDARGKEVCTRTTACRGMYSVAEWKDVCSLNFIAKAGSQYELFISKSNKIILRDRTDPQKNEARECHQISHRSRSEPKTRYSESSC